MKITCTKQEKNILEKIFEDENAKCPFIGIDISNNTCGTWKNCLECIENAFFIEWEVID